MIVALLPTSGHSAPQGKRMERDSLVAVWPPTAAVAAGAGPRPMSPMQALRRKCLDCSGQQPTEVKLCEAVTCALWPFRAGRHPYTRTRLQEALSQPRAPDGTPDAPNRSSSEIGPQQACFGEDGDRQQVRAAAIAAGTAV